MNPLIDKLGTQTFAFLNSLKDENTINLAQGHSDIDPPSTYIDYFKEEAKNIHYHKNYPSFHGQQKLLKAVSDYYYSKYNVKVDPDSEICILHGGKSSLWMVPLSQLSPNDNIIVFNPGYPDYNSGITLANANRINVDLDKNYNLDLKKIQGLKNISMIITNSPHNPTGKIFSYEDCSNLVKHASKNNIKLFNDFVYGDIVFDVKKQFSMLKIPKFKDLGVELFSFSKSFRLPGWRLAFLIGNKEIINDVKKIQEHFYIGNYEGIQSAATKILSSDNSYDINMTNDIYVNRKNLITRKLKDLNIRGHVPEGGLFYWIYLGDNIDSIEFTEKLIDKHNILVAPGTFFGDNCENYIRLGLITETDKLLFTIEKIHEVLCDEYFL